MKRIRAFFWWSWADLIPQKRIHCNPEAMIARNSDTASTTWEDIFAGIRGSMLDIAGAPYDKDPQRYERFSPIRHVH